MKTTKLITYLALSALSSTVYASNFKDEIIDHTNSLVKIDSPYSSIMLNENTTNINQKQLFLLHQRQAGCLDDNSLYIGARLLTIADYQDSTEGGKFGWQMRHPTPNNQIGKEVTEAVVHSAQIGFTGNILPWFTTFAELLYDPQQGFGEGTVTALERNEVQLRKAYAIIGDLASFPVYLTIGKFQTPFGLMDTVDPFSSSTVWHAFSGLAYGAKLAIFWRGLNASVEMAQGGAQFRAMQTSVGDTAVPSRLNNIVLDANYQTPIAQSINFLAGVSYLKGSNYCQDFPILHFEACDNNNPAYDAYARINWNRFTVQGEVAQTGHVWPGTHNPQPPLDQYEASKVTAFDVGAKYTAPICYRDYDFSLSFSEFFAGPDGAPWHRQSQLVAGFATWFKTVKLFSEYVRVNGYAPLNFISGSLPDEPFPAGTTHSQANVVNNIVVIGIDATI